MVATVERRGRCHRLVERVTRKKLIDVADTDTLLNRCLSAKRLTFVGIGSMVGAGIYLLVGVAAKTLAGPSVIISFLLASFCICMTSFCFAEFASRIPKSGNPYLYIYMAYGEFIAFLIGWGYILSYISSGALSARAWSGYVDSLMNNAIKNFTMNTIGKWSVGDPISEYPDFVAFAVQLVVVFIAASGAQCSTAINSVLAGLNIVVLSIFMVMGAIFGDVKNWHDQEHGGFFPFGVEGMMQGTSACFYAFFGFETVCIAAEEAKDPSKSVPRALLASIAITTLLYVGTATAFTLLVPFWLVDERAPLAAAFDHTGHSWMKYIISTGPLLGFSNILLLNIYGFSRLCFSLAEEGLLLKACSKVHRKTKVPMVPLIGGGLAMCFGAMFLELENLFRFTVITAILPFALVSFGVLILRYDPAYNKPQRNGQPYTKNDLTPELGVPMRTSKYCIFCCRYLKNELRTLFACLGIRLHVLFIFLATALLSTLILRGGDGITQQSNLSLVTMGLLSSFILLSVCAMVSFETPEVTSAFKVPVFPLFPLISGMLNVFFLVAATDMGSAISYSVVILIGLIVYIGILFCDTRHTIRPLEKFTEVEMETLLNEND